MITGVPSRATMKVIAEEKKSSKVPAPKATEANTYLVSLDEIYADSGSLPSMRRQTSRLSNISSKSDTSSAVSDTDEASSDATPKTPRSVFSRLLRR